MNYPTEALFINPFSLKGRKRGIIRKSSLWRLNSVLTKLLNNFVEVELYFTLMKSVSLIACKAWLDIIDCVYEISSWSAPVRIRELKSSAVVVRLLLILKPGLYYPIVWGCYQLSVSLYNLLFACFVYRTESFLQFDQHIIYGLAVEGIE
jgi:hypothetical protein